jgi:outer membrane protein assembly factor BamB
MLHTLLAAVAWLLPGDWHTVGGDAARSGRSDELGPATQKLLWSGGISATVSQQPLVEGDFVVTARIFNLGNTLNGTDIVAQDLHSGMILWQKQLPISFPDAWRSRLSGLRDGRVYATRAGNTNFEYLYALDVVTGAQLWQSQALIDETSTEGVTFADDGDPITSGGNGLVRIDAVTGLTVWDVPRACPTSGGCDAVCSGKKVYAWEPGGMGPVITAFDADTGMRLYSTPGVLGGIVQQVAPFVGPDGTVYAPRTQNNPATDYLVAFADTGSALVEKWKSPIGYVPFASHAFGPDGSVYTYDRMQRIVRLDPTSGMVLDTSRSFPFDFPMQPRMAADAAGRVYLTNGGFGQGRVFCFTPDLALLWSEAVPNVNVGGPALGAGGILVVAGTGTNVRAYDPCPTPVTYCTAKPGLACGLPAIASSGKPSTSASSGFVVSAAPARSERLGVLLYTDAGRDVLPFPSGGHVLCVAVPVRRGGPADSGGTPGPNCDGVFALDLNAFAAGAYNPPFPAHVPAAFLSSVGTQVNCQWWGRDTVASGSFMSDALEYSVCP